MPHKDLAKRRAYQSRYRKKHRREFSRRHRLWVAKNREHVKAYNRNRPIKPAWLRLKRLTQEEFDAKLKKQRNRCALCREPFTKKNPPVVDHDHATEKTRDLLHSKCNVGLGQFDDSPRKCIQAAAYLRRHHGKRHNVR